MVSSSACLPVNHLASRGRPALAENVTFDVWRGIPSIFGPHNDFALSASLPGNTPEVLRFLFSLVEGWVGGKGESPWCRTESLR